MGGVAGPKKQKNYTEPLSQSTDQKIIPGPIPQKNGSFREIQLKKSILDDFSIYVQFDN